MPEEQQSASRWHRRAAKNVVLGGMAYGLDTLLVLTYTLLLARSLGTRDFGTFTFSISLALLAYLPVDFGTSLAVVRGAATQSLDTRLFLSLTRFRLTCIPVLVLLASLVMWAGRVTGGLPSVLSMLFVSEGLACTTNGYLALLRGQGRLERILVVSGVEKIALILLLLSASRGFYVPGGLLGVGISFVAARIIALTAALCASWTGIKALTPVPGAAPRLSEFLKSSRHLGAFLLVERGAFYLIPILLTIVSGPMETGIFQACFKVALVPVALVSALSNGLYPVLADIAREQPAKMATPFGIALTLNQWVASVAVTLMLVTPRELLEILFGADYTAGVTTLRALTPYVLLAAVWQLSLYSLTALRQDRFVFRASICCLIVTALGLAGLGARMGSLGGAIAVGIGQAVAVAVCWPALLEAKLTRNRGWTAIGGTLALGLLVAAAFVIRRNVNLEPWGLLLMTLALSIVALPFMYLGLRLVGKNEVRAVRNAWGRAG